MLSPRRPKYRKQQTQARQLYGKETRGTELSFGDYGLIAVEPGWISSRVIEAGRVAIARKAKRGGKIWIRIFPDKPLTKKPAEVRMGKGKGSTEGWVAVVRSGRVLYEVTGVAEDVALLALQRAAAKMPIKCKVIKRSEFLI